MFEKVVEFKVGPPRLKTSEVVMVLHYAMTFVSNFRWFFLWLGKSMKADSILLNSEAVTAPSPNSSRGLFVLSTINLVNIRERRQAESYWCKWIDVVGGLRKLRYRVKAEIIRIVDKVCKKPFKEVWWLGVPM